MIVYNFLFFGLNYYLMNFHNSKMDIGYKVDENRYHRFDEKNHMIYRRLWDKSLSTYKQMFDKNIKDHINSSKEGYTRLDFAFVKAGWTVYEKFPFAFAWEDDSTNNQDYGTDWLKKKHKIKHIESFTNKIKLIAKSYGASLVGIANVNNKWIYKTGFVRPRFVSEDKAKEEIRMGKLDDSSLEHPIEIPKEFNKVIVMAIEMDAKAIATAPAQPAAAAASIAYSKMAFSIACMGEFIRNLGYKAIQCGNDTALSVPLAIEAGLGALGRIGILITPEFGPRVRLCKVFTNIPLKSDEPDYGFIDKVKNTCQSCYECADACENDAISTLPDPKMKRSSISNNPGVKKYYVNVEKCFEFWIKNSSDCGACIAACPFSRIKNHIEPSKFWKL
ncbi:MAG: 4Fe-4S dicluster domain-containing protein [Candidatus Lokiarchaeota archaeon]|nr:4Fe-4S dicluster domain-containing protein [Candidatus Lokiarchaeota archaeon]MBD3198435.1 4Fe-4S dicluster domain-containing protein [Candidatus Lokiarchaeota archaeon]